MNHFPIYDLVLLHDPVLNRDGETVVTSVTNLDLHDLSRTAKTYGARAFHIVTPVLDQQDLVQKILDHWKTARSKEKHPKRVEALSLIQCANNLDEVLNKIEKREGQKAKLIFTDARPYANAVSYPKMRFQMMEDLNTPWLVILGTGWGIEPEFMKKGDYFLEPLRGPGAYNHLSVRAAGAAILDRLFSSTD